MKNYIIALTFIMIILSITANIIAANFITKKNERETKNKEQDKKTETKEKGLIIDFFAGGGGASTGIEKAINREIDIAINHDVDAIAMHEINHPKTKHYQEDVWEVDPIECCQGREVDLAWFSPTCTHFSKAKGGKPKDKKIRSQAWVAIKWAKAVKPKIIILENVEEFQHWGPVDENGIPIKEKQGETFNDFVEAFKNLGYIVEWKELRAADFGVPTIRKRFFLIARCDGNPIVWSKPTHKNKEDKDFEEKNLLPWVESSTIIDWSIPGKSIFNRKKELVDNTKIRIGRGFDKFVYKSEKPFVINKEETFLASEVEKEDVNYKDEAVDCLTKNKENLTVGYLVQHYGGNYKGNGISLEKPLGTITTVDHHALITCFLTKYYGNDDGQSLQTPLHTITTVSKFALVIIKHEKYIVTDILMRMLVPRELFNANGFPATYVIDTDAKGKKITQAKQIARCGNSVPPELSYVLVRDNYCV